MRSQFEWIEWTEAKMKTPLSGSMLPEGGVLLVDDKTVVKYELRIHNVRDNQNIMTKQ